MRRVQALLAVVVLFFGNALGPLCACVLVAHHHCCCDERITEPTIDAGRKDCCERAATVTSAPQAMAFPDAAVATIPLPTGSVAPPALVERADARPKNPVLATPRGPPKVPIYLQVEALLC